MDAIDLVVRPPWRPAGRRWHHRAPALRRRPHPQGRPADRGLRHGRRGRRRARPGPRRARHEEPVRRRSTPASRRLAELILRFQRELFVVGAELATNPAAVGPAGGRRDPRLGARWSTALDARCVVDLEKRDRDAPRVRRPGRDPDERRARAGADDHPPRRAPRSHPRGRQDCSAGRAPATVFEPARRPGLGARPGRRAGRSENQHAGAAGRPPDGARNRSHELLPDTIPARRPAGCPAVDRPASARPSPGCSRAW